MLLLASLTLHLTLLALLWSSDPSISLGSTTLPIMSQGQPPISGNGPAPFSTERARATVAICIVFMVLATVAVFARFWSRRLKRMKPALDDYLIVIGLIFYYFSAVETILQVGIGRLGHHLHDGITPGQLIAIGKVC